MALPEIEKQYQCGGCQTVHLDLGDARECCPVIEVYVCPTCESVYREHKEAWQCCLAGNEEGTELDG